MPALNTKKYLDAEGITHLLQRIASEYPDNGTLQTVVDAIEEALNEKQGNINANGILKGDGVGTISEAVAGTDYLAPMTATTSPSSNGNAVEFIDTISQNAQGKINATKKTIPFASSSTEGITKLGAAGGAELYGSAAIAEQAAKDYADNLISALGSYLTLRGTRESEADIKAITDAEAGDVYINISDNSEWVCVESISVASPMAWEKLGYNMDLSRFAEAADLGIMSRANTASGTFAPVGSITINAYTPDGAISTDKNGNTNYTPEGSVSTPEITVVPDTGTVNSITSVGTLPTWTASVSDETLVFDFKPGTLPAKGEDTTVVTGIISATSSQPTFTGESTEIKFTGTAKAPTGSFSGMTGNVIVTPDMNENGGTGS